MHTKHKIIKCGHLCFIKYAYPGHSLDTNMYQILCICINVFGYVSDIVIFGRVRKRIYIGQEYYHQ